jgi:hypothetical protein
MTGIAELRRKTPEAQKTYRRDMNSSPAAIGDF